MFIIDPYRYGGGAPPAPVADLLLDFKNGVYRKDGVTDTFTALGGTNTGTVTPGVGLTTTGSQIAIMPYDANVECVFVVDADDVTAATRYAMEYGAAPNSISIAMLRLAGPDQYFFQIVVPSFGQSTLAGKAVFGVQGGRARVCIAGGAVNDLGAAAVPTPVSPEVGVGNYRGAPLPWTGVIRSVAIYKGTFSDAQIQALST